MPFVTPVKYQLEKYKQIKKKLEKMYNSIVFLYLIDLIKNRYKVNVINIVVPVNKVSTLKSIRLKSFANKRKPYSILLEIRKSEESTLL